MVRILVRTRTRARTRSRCESQCLGGRGLRTWHTTSDRGAKIKRWDGRNKPRTGLELHIFWCLFCLSFVEVKERNLTRTLNMGKGKKREEEKKRQ